MNCPGAILVFNEKLHSYRELPKKLIEFGMDHRHELSGVLSGLFRVRAFTQDDAHIFVTPFNVLCKVSCQKRGSECYQSNFKKWQTSNEGQMPGLRYCYVQDWCKLNFYFGEYHHL
jgi:glycyl-tRNA synthetase (class II)